MAFIVNYNFHTHTVRCGHATGTDEEYVLEAIKAGIKVLGFSDHAPFKNITHHGMRMDYSELEGYISSINSLKEKYKDQIEIHVGLEIEYSDEYLDYYKELLNNGIEYLIIGQHCEIHDGKCNFNYSKMDNFEQATNYTNSVVKAIESGLFTYIAHPDIFLRTCRKIDENWINLINRIVDASIKCDVPLEINMGGVRFSNYIAEIYGGQPYPNHYFWEIASEKGAKTVIGCDHHNPKEINESPNWFFEQFIEKNHINLIKDFNIKR